LLPNRFPKQQLSVTGASKLSSLIVPPEGRSKRPERPSVLKSLVTYYRITSHLNPTLKRRVGLKMNSISLNKNSSKDVAIK